MKTLASIAALAAALALTPALAKETAKTAGQATETAAQTDESRIEEVVSPGGITAWLVEEPAIPIVTVQIAFAGGARLDPAGKEGASNLAAALVEEGAGDMDNREFADALEELSSAIGFGAGRDSFTVSVSSLAENIGPTMDLLRVALTEPAFDGEAIERVREQVLSGLRSAENDARTKAGERWYAEVFVDSAYGRSTSGTIETVEALTREDLVAAFDRMIGRAQMKVGVVGDIDAERLAELLDSTFGPLPEGAEPETEPFEVRDTGGLAVIEMDVPQSAVVFGHKGILRDDEDYIPAYVMNYVLGGGGLTSRLTDEVREKNGLAYSVYSYLYPLDRAGLYMGGVATANERVAKSLELIRAEWARMAKGGLTEAELEAAKTYLTGSFALRFDSNAKIASFLVGAQSADLPIDYIDTRNGLVEAVTLEDVSRVAKRLLKPDDLFVVVVGKPEGLKDADSLMEGIGG